MTINVVYGNLVEVVESRRLYEEGTALVVLHGCNCYNRMGAGVALDIATAWPEAEQADLATNMGDKRKLGRWSQALVTREEMTFEVLNLYTQYRYGPARERNFDIEAFRSICERLGAHYRGLNTHFVFPLIGTGTGGGHWNEIVPIIEEHLGDFKLTLVKYVPYGGVHPSTRGSG